MTTYKYKVLKKHVEKEDFEKFADIEIHTSITNLRKNTMKLSSQHVTSRYYKHDKKADTWKEKITEEIYYPTSQKIIDRGKWVKVLPEQALREINDVLKESTHGNVFAFGEKNIKHIEAVGWYNMKAKGNFVPKI